MLVKRPQICSFYRSAFSPKSREQPQVIEVGERCFNVDCKAIQKIRLKFLRFYIERLCGFVQKKLTVSVIPFHKIWINKQELLEWHEHGKKSIHVCKSFYRIP